MASPKCDREARFSGGARDGSRPQQPWTVPAVDHAGGLSCLRPGSCLHLGTAARPAEQEVPSTCPPFLVSDPVKAAYGERCIDHGRISPSHATQLGLKKGALLECAEGPSPLWVCVVQRLVHDAGRRAVD